MGTEILYSEYTTSFTCTLQQECRGRELWGLPRRVPCQSHISSEVNQGVWPLLLFSTRSTPVLNTGGYVQFEYIVLVPEFGDLFLLGKTRFFN
jgi:hypothetical protein